MKAFVKSAVVMVGFLALTLSAAGLVTAQQPGGSWKKETIYENMKDLEFEYKMGKLAEEDYQRLRDDYSREAFEIISKIESVQPEILAKAGKPQVVAVLKSGKKSKKSV